MKALIIRQPWGFAMQRVFTNIPCFEELNPEGIVSSVPKDYSLSNFEVCNDKGR